MTTLLILTADGLGYNDATEVTFGVRLVIFWLKNLVISNVGQLRFLILIQIMVLSLRIFILVSFIFIITVLVVDETFNPSLCSDLYQKMMYDSSIYKNTKKVQTLKNFVTNPGFLKRHGN